MLDQLRQAVETNERITRELNDSRQRITAMETENSKLSSQNRSLSENLRSANEELRSAREDSLRLQRQLREQSESNARLENARKLEEQAASRTAEAERLRSRSEEAIAAADQREREASRKADEADELIKQQRSKIDAEVDKERECLNRENEWELRRTANRLKARCGALCAILAAYGIVPTLLQLWTLRVTTVSAAAWAARIAATVAAAATAGAGAVGRLCAAIPDERWRGPVLILVCVILAAALLAGVAWLGVITAKAIGKMAGEYRDRGTLALHAAAWTAIACAALTIALNACSVIPAAHTHWPTLWIGFTVAGLAAWHYAVAWRLENMLHY